MTTPYHARYFAYELTRRRQPEGVDRLSMALFDACVDLNPHQIEAALFAAGAIERGDLPALVGQAGQRAGSTEVGIVGMGYDHKGAGHEQSPFGSQKSGLSAADP